MREEIISSIGSIEKSIRTLGELFNETLSKKTRSSYAAILYTIEEANCELDKVFSLNNWDKTDDYCIRIDMAAICIRECLREIEKSSQSLFTQQHGDNFHHETIISLLVIIKKRIRTIYKMLVVGKSTETKTYLKNQ